MYLLYKESESIILDVFLNQEPWSIQVLSFLLWKNSHFLLSYSKDSYEENLLKELIVLDRVSNANEKNSKESTKIDKNRKMEIKETILHQTPTRHLRDILSNNWFLQNNGDDTKYVYEYLITVSPQVQTITVRSKPFQSESVFTSALCWQAHFKSKELLTNFHPQFTALRVHKKFECILD